MAEPHLGMIAKNMVALEQRKPRIELDGRVVRKIYDHSGKSVHSVKGYAKKPPMLGNGRDSWFGDIIVHLFQVLHTSN